MSNTPVMESEDLIANLQRERDDLAAECMALAERLRQTADMRDVAGQLRAVHMELQASAWSDARHRVADLLRRLDESQ